MGDKTKIEWTDASWTPVRARYFEIQDDGSGKERIGWHCEHVSEGCRNCYSERMNLRLGTGRDFKPGELYREEHKGYNNGESKLFLDEEMLLQPLRWKQPRMIFVCSMTDLFADFVPNEWIDRVFAVMALAPQHTFQVLTKRAERMRHYLTAPHRPGQFTTVLDDGRIIDTPAAHIRTHSVMCNLLPKAPASALNRAVTWQDKKWPDGDGFIRSWPLPNVWLGTSSEDQRRANERIPHLLNTPAAVRFLSAEPLLGPIDLTRIDYGRPFHINALAGYFDHTCGRDQQTRLDWVIGGGESGSGARPAHPDWFRSLRDQCAAAGVSYFHKQNGEFASVSEVAGPGRHFTFPDGATVRRVGKKAAGRLLDGIEHNGMPTGFLGRSAALTEGEVG